MTRHPFNDRRGDQQGSRPGRQRCPVVPDRSAADRLSNWKGNPVDLSKIVRCAIHPAIGIARVGNSDEWFVGPEVPGLTPKPEGGYKDTAGRIRRQVARFRIYGYDAAGKVVGEVTAADADIAWTVHVANKKAAWYQVQQPFDTLDTDADPPKRRNCHQTDRAKLVIDPGDRTLDEPGQSASFDSATVSITFDNGDSASVPLGSIRMEESGRLLFIAGCGKADSPTDGTGLPSIANNDRWHDDICDGPVAATVKIPDHPGPDPMPVTSAWIISAPPDYSPGIRSVVTLYDVVYEVALKLGYPPPPAVSFTDHIYPILERFCQLQWVNQGFNELFGWGRPGHLLGSATLQELSKNSIDYYEKRQALFARFRKWDYSEVETEPDPTKRKLPVIFGDDPMAKQEPGLRRTHLAVTELQYGWLQQWANGTFQQDWTGSPPAVHEKLEDLLPAEQPHALDRAALEPCVGGPFHPGCEAPWTLRKRRMYDTPFRIKRRAAPAPDLGDELTRDDVFKAGGPLDGSDPGDLTKWMAIPWQADTYGCAAIFGLKKEGSFVAAEERIGYLPTFWPARVPTHVLPEATYAAITSTNLWTPYDPAVFGSPLQWLWFLTRVFGTTITTWNPQLGHRQNLFNIVRPKWVRHVADNGDRFVAFAKNWCHFGIVTREKGPGGDGVPDTLYVEKGVPANLSGILADL
jgi:hypothetical protein